MTEKQVFEWYSQTVEQHVRMVRWGHFGAPVLLFPTAGGDAEEVERFHLVGAVEGLIDSGRIKVYSIDSIAGRAWISGAHSGEYCARLQNRFHGLIYHEVTPVIRSDCRTEGIEIITVGASIGAFNAVATVCRYPDAYRLAIGMSGTFDLSKFMHGPLNEDFYFSSPLHFVSGLDGEALEALRRRLIILPSGEGPYEDIGESWRLAHVLGAKGIPNRVDPWGARYAHEWGTWREMLPRYLNEFA